MRTIRTRQLTDVCVWHKFKAQYAYHAIIKPYVIISFIFIQPWALITLYNCWFQVVITNEMTTRLGLSSGEVVGSMGDAWAHRCNKRLLLCNTDGERTALTLKDNDADNIVGKFQVCAFYSCLTANCRHRFKSYLPFSLFSRSWGPNSL